MSRLSLPAAGAALAQETDKVFLHLLTVETSGGAVLRFADNNQPVESRGQVFHAAAFTVVLPEQSGSAPRPCRLVIDNTDLVIFQTIKQAAGQTVTVTFRSLYFSGPRSYTSGASAVTTQIVRASRETVEGEVCDFYLSDRKFPRGAYTPEDFEGMFF